MYLVDTDWVIQTLTGHQHAARTIYKLTASQLHVSIVTAGELYERAFLSVNPQAHLASFRHFLNTYQVLPITDSIMERFAEIRSFLRRHGQLIPDFDILIAATAIQHRLTLMTFNRRHFQRIPTLDLYQPN